MLSNIVNILKEDNKSEEKEMQIPYLPRGQKIGIDIESSKIDITFANEEINPTVKEVFKK